MLGKLNLGLGKHVGQIVRPAATVRIQLDIPQNKGRSLFGGSPLRVATASALWQQSGYSYGNGDTSL
jgi:hypothetical protein